MSTLGKVLLFLNLLAAAGLAYLTAMDWGKRQEISAVVLRYHLTLQGLPIEAAKTSDDADIVPIEIKNPAGTTTQVMRKKIIDEHFKGFPGGDRFGGGTYVLSLIAELERATNKLIEQIEAQKNDDGKLAFLVGAQTPTGFQPGLLMTLAESYDERAAVKALAFPAPQADRVKTNADAARKRLDRKIEALKTPPAPKDLEAAALVIADLKDKIVKNPADAGAKAELAALSGLGQPPFTRDDSDRRRRIAHFLMLLDTSGAWQNRVARVAGLKTYSIALNEQVARLADIARQTERTIESDQATFEAEYDLLKRLAVKQDALTTEEQRLVAGLIEMESLDSGSVAARKTQLANLKKDLADLQAQIAAVLKTQAEAEKTVFDLQRKVGDTLSGNLELEAKLGQTEAPKP